MRCIKARRVCHGYEHGASSAFRQYEVGSSNQSLSFPSSARKCSLPKRVPNPGTVVVPEDTIPVETSEEESNWFAFRAFLYDFCLVSTNSNLSRGYLSELEMMAHRLGPNSDLVKACQAVGFASRGKPLHRPQLMHKAERFYHELLGSLARAIEDPSSVNIAESKLVSMLLGLYQVCLPTSTYAHEL